jgi:cyclin-dependent kinase 8/11
LIILLYYYRAYRAPELLFGSRNYDHVAIDLWSLGTVFAEFFTALRLSGEEDDGDDDDDDDEPDDTSEGVRIEPFIVPKYLRIGYPGAQWNRDSLFNGERGEIGLAWSIFKIFGTPTSNNWPVCLSCPLYSMALLIMSPQEFEGLPGASSVVFNVVPSVPLLPLLPNLPPSSIHPSPNDPTSNISPVENLISQFLMYPAASRLRAKDAIRHPWFIGAGSTLLLPKGYALASETELNNVAVYEWKGNTLGEWLHSVLPSIPGGRS